MLITPILINALIASSLASIAGGITGSYISVKNMRFVSGSINHAILGGVGVTLWLSELVHINISSYIGIFISVILSALLLSRAHLYNKETEDSVASAIWIIGSSIGMLFASITDHGNIKLMEILMGSMFYINRTEILMLLMLDILLITIFYVFRKHMSLLCLDEEFAKKINIKTNVFYIILIVLFGISSAIISITMGTLLSLSLLIIPPTIALKTSSSISSTIFRSIALALTCSILGIVIAVATGSSASACISLLSGIMYCIYMIFIKLA